MLSIGHGKERMFIAVRILIELLLLWTIVLLYCLLVIVPVDIGYGPAVYFVLYSNESILRISVTASLGLFAIAAVMTSPIAYRIFVGCGMIGIGIGWFFLVAESDKPVFTILTGVPFLALGITQFLGGGPEPRDRRGFDVVVPGEGPNTGQWMRSSGKRRNEDVDW